MGAVRRSIAQLLKWVVKWWWEKTCVAWIQAWHEPDLLVRIIFLAIGAVLFYYVGRYHAFAVSLTTGLSYVGASFWVISRATVFRMVGRLPLGVAAPILVFCGVILTGSIKPVIHAATDEALGGRLLEAAILLVPIVFLTEVANRLKRGQLPNGQYGSELGDEAANRKTRTSRRGFRRRR